MNKTKPLILITNDDGVSAPGINALIAVMSEIGEIVVVAPDKPQSGMGHAITTNETLYLNKISLENDPITIYSCSGTPADCVKIAVNEVLKRKPDLCVSGVNHGSNSSINVIYSGTMSAAIEAGIEGIPAIGFSLLDFDWNANFEEIKPFIRKIALEALENKLPKDVVLNVNFP
ncbi:MAG: 5'/3'-nucleotidase SurE, partial [Flavobacteriales bacterium 32-34-25]